MRVATFCGSTSATSANRVVLDTAAAVLRERGHEVIESGGVADIPVFRPESVDDAPPPVTALRACFDSADAVLLAAPEYAGGAAGWAKNALDWMVGSASLYERVAAVLCAGTTGGHHAIEQIARTLTWQGALVVATLGVGAPRTKIDAAGRVSDPATMVAIEDLVTALVVAAAADQRTRARLASDAVRALGIDPLNRT